MKKFGLLLLSSTFASAACKADSDCDNGHYCYRPGHKDAVCAKQGLLGNSGSPAGTGECVHTNDCKPGQHCYRPGAKDSKCISNDKLGSGKVNPSDFKWEFSKGVTFDVSALHSEKKGYRVLDDNALNNSVYEYAYYFNIGSDLDRTAFPEVEKYCANTSAYANSGGSGPSVQAPAYQLWNDKSRCEKIGGPVSSETFRYYLADHIDRPDVDAKDLDPSKGFAVYYEGGDHCGGDSKHNNRTLTMVFRCEADDTPLPEHEPVMESETCHYQMEIPTIHGCPGECLKFGGKLCGGHGECGYDRDNGKAGCMCDEGFFGPDCTANCKGGCGDHGHCAYNRDGKRAECFCNGGYGGSGCAPVATVKEDGSGGSGGGGGALGWVFFVLTLISLILFVIYHRRSMAVNGAGPKTYDNFIDDGDVGYTPPGESHTHV